MTRHAHPIRHPQTTLTHRSARTPVGRFRSVAVAAAVGSLLAAGSGPAWADSGDTLALTSTGLTDGQLLGINNLIRPTWTGDVTEIDIWVNATPVGVYTTWDNGVHVPLTNAENNTDIQVTVEIHDAAGDTAAGTTRAHVDLLKPGAIFSPALGQVVTATTTLTATQRSDDVARITLTDTGTNQQLDTVTAAPWQLTWDTIAHPHITLTVTDFAGNAHTYQPFYEVDNTPPTISEPHFDRAPGRVHGPTTIGVDLPDDTGVNRDEFWIDGILVQHLEFGPDATFAGDGLYNDFGTTERTSTVEVRAWDRAGHEATRTFTVTVDSTGPVITSTTPANGTLVRGRTIRSTIHATDPAGIYGAWLDHYPATADHGYTGSIPAGRDGRHILTWQAGDPFFNLSKPVTIWVTVDNTRPGLTITSAPKNGAKVSGTVRVTAAGSDRNGIDRIELIINGKVAATSHTATHRFSIDTKKYGKTLKIQLRTYDKAGNTTTSATCTWHH